jgi:hypothetical protein
MTRHRILVALTAMLVVSAGAADAATPSVSILEPVDGATVSSPFKLRFAVEGLTVAPAGAPSVGTGHHHLLIDGAPIAEGQPVPVDATHIHFGKGQTETEVTLSPGIHKLTAQFATGEHKSYGPALSKTITITVK